MWERDREDSSTDVFLFSITFLGSRECELFKDAVQEVLHQSDRSLANLQKSTYRCDPYVDFCRFRTYNLRSNLRRIVTIRSLWSDGSFMVVPTYGWTFDSRIVSYWRGKTLNPKTLNFKWNPTGGWSCIPEVFVKASELHMFLCYA